ncbi:MAG TPA: ThuA domain-containing protein [Herpetosiphonaceae bacterium]|nr:ThuA domain-containing protein [Herpetosiphonaceae bacterium]
MRTLVLCDDYWHPACTARAGLGPLMDAGFTFDWVENACEWSAVRMDEYPVVLLTKSNNVSSSDRTPWVTEEVQAAFVEYVRRGNGLLVIHSGSADYRELPVLRRLLGGVFASHPPQCAVTVEPCEGHSLVTGSTPFTLVDEHYIMDLDDGEADVFLTTTSEHGTQPGGWTRTEGDGRVCLLTPGHNLPVWLHPSYQALLRNALRWCGKMETG